MHLIEYQIALRAIIKNSDTAAQNKIMFAGQVVSETETRRKLDARIVDEIFGNSLTGGEETIGQITRIWNYAPHV